MDVVMHHQILNACPLKPIWQLSSLSYYFPLHYPFSSLPVTSVSVICEAAVESNPELKSKANTREDNLMFKTLIVGSVKQTLHLPRVQDF